MSSTFAESLKALRKARKISQQQLAAKLYVDRSTVARWETGTRIPDTALLPKLAAELGCDTATLLSAISKPTELPNIMVVDDEQVVLKGTVALLESTFPNAYVVGFERASEALAFASENYVSLAFLDIELGRTSGLMLCRKILEISPQTNVVYLTAYRDYALDAWETGACGFLLKPVSEQALRERASHLPYPVPGLD